MYFAFYTKTAVIIWIFKFENDKISLRQGALTIFRLCDIMKRDIFHIFGTLYDVSSERQWESRLREREMTQFGKDRNPLESRAKRGRARVLQMCASYEKPNRHRFADLSSRHHKKRYISCTLFLYFFYICRNIFCE